MPIRVRFVGIATSLLLALASLAGPLAAPASAGFAFLCTGYKACSQQGMTASGYAQVSQTSYWRMYVGHNCTNYAAYRMVKSGLPNTRPWSGSGNAENWGTAMPTITDQTPRVGAVAWWKENVWPAGSAGHVAYVEQVVSPTEIIVSQDSWGGDFSWARVTKDSRGWPNGFIHFNDVLVKNTAPPVVSGEARVGSTLTTTAGTWSKVDISLSYQWMADGAAIPGATGATLLLEPAQLGRAISVAVTATRSGYSPTSATSAPTLPVGLGLLRADATPSLTGEPVVDETLVADAGTWYPEPEVVRYVWRADGERLTANDDLTALDLTPELLGKTVTVTTRLRRDGFERVVTTTAAPGPVAPGTLQTTPSSVTGTPRLGERLRVTPGAAAPAATTTVQWYRSGAPVDGATRPAYRLTEADLGQKVYAVVTHTRVGYTTVEERLADSAYVRSVTAMTLEVEPGVRRGRAKVRATFTAPGVAVVTGTVRIRQGGVVLAEVPLVDGAISRTLTGLEAGRRRIKVVYTGSPSTTWVAAAQVVRVR